jgi:hypothetical protein
LKQKPRSVSYRSISKRRDVFSLQGVPVKTIEESEKETAERLKTLQVEENERMAQPTLKSILSKNRPQTYISVEELDERFIQFDFKENPNLLFSYYIMDGSKRRVTFDEEDNNEALPPIETEETVENDDDEVEETEDVINVDLTEEFDESMSE